MRSPALLSLVGVVVALSDGLGGMTENGDASLYLMTDGAVADGAVCLDGTPGGYYFEPGSGDGVDKWFIHHEGGGWCESLDDCLARSTTNLGSSSAYPANVSLGGGYFSRDIAQNPLMYNWNHVSLKYCDGGSFSGNNETALSYKGTKLYFRGDRVRRAMALSLFTDMHMDKASDLVVGGCSAGGLASYLHTDFWCDMAKQSNPSVKCVGLPDSGFFLDYQDPTVECTPDSPQAAVDRYGSTINGNYHCGLKWVFAIQNASRGMNVDCMVAHPKDSFMCMFAEHTAEHIRWPIFAMQSQYDSWQIAHVQGNGGAAKTQVLGNNITARLQANLLGHNQDSGAFLDSCDHHCGAWNTVRIDEDLVSVALQKWYNSIGQSGGKKLWNQNMAFPCADCCKP